jgi:GNAT superfamily N-acetyltransferase
MSLTIVRAQPDDAALLRTICIAAKGHWGYSAALMAAFAQLPIITAESISSDIVYKACLADTTVGWYRLLAKPPTAMLDDLWVVPDQIGQGVGRALFQHMLAQAVLLGAQAVELDADPNAVPFYERMGCQTIGETLSEWGRMIPRMRYEPTQTSR